MSARERDRAIGEGSALVATYGDTVTRERIADHLRRARRNMIGNRPRRDAVVVVSGENGSLRIQGSDFYAAKFWEPRRYQQWVDARWAPLPSGRVDVRELEVVRDDKASAPEGDEPTGD